MNYGFQDRADFLQDPPNGDSIEEEARHWVLLALSDNFSEADAERLTVWRRISPRHENAWREAAQTWRDADALRDSFSEPPLIAEQELTDQKRFSAFSPRSVFGVLLAASLALMAVLYANDMAIWLQADHTTSNGEISRVTLPDGTKVHLNTASAISFDYSNARRQVSLLRGEAVFEVEKDPGRPFDVLAKSGVTTALGTIFVVRAKADETIITVSEGRVQVASNSKLKDRTVVLNASQRTVYRAGHEPGQLRTVAPEVIAAWRNEIILIEKLSFAEAVSELDRYKTGRIVVAANTSSLKPVTARFSTRDVKGAVDALAKTHGLRVNRFTPWLTVLH